MWQTHCRVVRDSAESTSSVNGWLPDASLLLELRRPSPDPVVTAWSNAQPRESFFLSTATIAAIRHYTELRGDAPLRTEVEIWLGHTLQPWFAGRILPVTGDIILEWLRIRNQRQPVEGSPSEPALLLAATARVHRLTVCTRDNRACLLAGVPAFNPWNAPCL